MEHHEPGFHCQVPSLVFSEFPQRLITPSLPTAVRGSRAPVLPIPPIPGRNDGCVKLSGITAVLTPPSCHPPEAQATAEPVHRTGSHAELLRPKSCAQLINWTHASRKSPQRDLAQRKRRGVRGDGEKGELGHPLRIQQEGDLSQFPNMESLLIISDRKHRTHSGKSLA